MMDAGTRLPVGGGFPVCKCRSLRGTERVAETEDDDAAGTNPSLAGGQVVRLVDFDRTNPARILSEMREYWNGLRKGRAVPARSDVDPRGIHRALDHAFILERIAPGAARFRLAGQHLIDLMGMEVRGMPVCTLMNPSSRGRFSDVLESVFRAPQLAELRLDSGGGYARPELGARMLLLPLRSDLGDVTRALGCLISRGPMGMAPRRFDIVSDVMIPVIEGGATIEPQPSAIGFADPPAPFATTGREKPAPPPSAAARRAAFRVVTSTQKPRPPSG